MMRDISGHFDGDLRVDDDARVMREVTIEGNVTVAAGMRVVIDGVVAGSLQVGRGADVTVNGRIVGEIHNDGGRVTGVGMHHDVQGPPAS
ncbi:Polymer-forming protein [Loktanella fryxellensis]|uniref:Polymer-forming protein n=1 Tax=Loktanella fryxellensis TaxID=245187 RepID=A0A1H8F986_9RHOB|nr:polymer-forming cytoskeletal protein [Loktanella fryxellensis]SEN27608.1 Polymer-forming protein [Loktanella fryxellensis]